MVTRIINVLQKPSQNYFINPMTQQAFLGILELLGNGKK